MYVEISHNCQVKPLVYLRYGSLTLRARPKPSPSSSLTVARGGDFLCKVVGSEVGWEEKRTPFEVTLKMSYIEKLSQLKQVNQKRSYITLAYDGKNHNHSVVYLVVVESR